MGRFLRLFTDLPLAEIELLERAREAELNAVKERLATEATALVHGPDAAREAELTARETFSQGAAVEGLPVIALTPEEVAAGLTLVDVVLRAGLVSSKGEARRAIAGRGVRLDGEIAAAAEATLAAHSLPLRLSFGRKRHVVLRLAGTGER